MRVRSPEYRARRQVRHAAGSQRRKSKKIIPGTDHNAHEDAYASRNVPRLGAQS